MPSSHDVAEHLSVVGDISDAAKQFINAVNWNQPWLIALLVFHALSFVLLIATRKMHSFQVGFFLFLILLAFAGETINSQGRAHWKAFADENYFDESGLFVTIVYGIPLVINSVVALFFMMLRVVDMLVKVKRAQLEQSARERQEQSKKSQ